MADGRSVIKAWILGDAESFKRAMREADQAGQKTASGWEAVGARMETTGRKLTVGVTVPLVAGFVKATDAASDLNEVVSKTEVVFGDASDAVLEWSQDSARAIGLSQRAALDGASSFGNLFTSLGKTQDEAATMSQRAVELAADLASFNNTSPEDAILAIGSALRGEAEPIRRYGVLMNDATLRQEALKLGLVQTTKEALDPATKAMAAYELVMSQTTTAQGDFARTADGLANKQRIAKAELENSAAAMGQVLLPIASELVGVVSKAATGFSELSPEMQKLIVYAGLAAAALGPLSTATGKVLSNVDTLKKAFIGPQGLNPALVGVTLAVGTAVAAWKFHQDAQERNRRRVEELTGALEEQGGVLEDAIDVTLRKQAVDRGLSDAYASLADKIPAVNRLVAEGSDVFSDAAKVVSNTSLATEQLRDRLDPVTLAIYDQAKAQGLSNNEIVKLLVLLDDYADASDDKREADEAAAKAAKAAFEATGGYDAALLKAQAALDGTTDSTDDLTDATDDAEGSTKDFTRVVTDTTSKLDRYRDAIDRTFGALLSADEATLKYQEGVRKLNDEWEQGSADSTNVKDAMYDLLGQTSDLTDAYADAGRIGGDVNSRLEFQRGLLIQLRDRYKELAPQLQPYIDKLNEIPGEVNTIINVNGRPVSRTALGLTPEDAIYAQLVPGLASGGTVKARPGGTLVRLGEGGEDEHVIPDSRLRGAQAGAGPTFIFMPNGVTPDSVLANQRLYTFRNGS